MTSRTVRRTGLAMLVACVLVLAAAVPAAAATDTARGPSPRTPADFLCTGDWHHEVSLVNFQRTLSGTVQWSFWLTNQVRAQFGPNATVSMPFAYVNGQPIQPPYQPHTMLTAFNYNYHSSFSRYNRIGAGQGTIQTGDRLTLYWLIEGADPKVLANRYITCAVPAAGSN